jgi:predicted TIM-barrel fold metal-dependent hydrolase
MQNGEHVSVKDGIFDADNHYYEPDDAFTRHLDRTMADHAVHVVRDRDDVGRPYIGSQPLYYLDRTPLDLIGRPGAQVADKEGRYRPLAEEDLIRPGDVPSFVERDARLKWMDEQNIEAVLLWPSLGLTVEHQLRDFPPACVANLRAFNRWLDDDWGFGSDGRVLGVPWLTLIDLNAAIAELEYVIDRGAKVIALLFAPVGGRSIADPYFDPFWARAAEAGVLIGFHGAESGYNEMLSIHWGESPRPLARAQSPFQRACFFGERPIMDTLAALVLHNLFGRFPSLQVLSIENGSMWVPYLLRVMEKGFRSGQYGEWLGGRFENSPTEIFRQHVSVAPFDDDDIRLLVDLIGADRVLLGSDYPHPEGVAEPSAFLEHAGLTEEEVRLVSRENLARLLGVTPSARG